VDDREEPLYGGGVLGRGERKKLNGTANRLCDTFGDVVFSKQHQHEVKGVRGSRRWQVNDMRGVNGVASGDLPVTEEREEKMKAAEGNKTTERIQREEMT